MSDAVVEFFRGLGRRGHEPLLAKVPRLFTAAVAPVSLPPKLLAKTLRPLLVV